METKVIKKGPGVEKLKQALERITHMDVLVGVPMNKNPRTETSINNAALLFLHTNGSPLQGIPARPVIEPAIQADGNREQITDQLGMAAQAVLQGNPALAVRCLHLAGQAGENVSREWFTDSRNGWPPNKPETVRRKIRKMSSKQFKEAAKSGEPLTRPLIDTGQLRKSIIYVVRENKND